MPELGRCVGVLWALKEQERRQIAASHHLEGLRQRVGGIEIVHQAAQPAPEPASEPAPRAEDEVLFLPWLSSERVEFPI